MSPYCYTYMLNMLKIRLYFCFTSIKLNLCKMCFIIYSNHLTIFMLFYTNNAHVCTSYQSTFDFVLILLLESLSMIRPYRNKKKSIIATFVLFNCLRVFNDHVESKLNSMPMLPRNRVNTSLQRRKSFFH